MAIPDGIDRKVNRNIIRWLLPTRDDRDAFNQGMREKLEGIHGKGFAHLDIHSGNAVVELEDLNGTYLDADSADWHNQDPIKLNDDKGQLMMMSKDLNEL